MGGEVTPTSGKRMRTRASVIPFHLGQNPVKEKGILWFEPPLWRCGLMVFVNRPPPGVRGPPGGGFGTLTQNLTWDLQV